MPTFEDGVPDYTGPASAPHPDICCCEECLASFRAAVEAVQLEHPEVVEVLEDDEEEFEPDPLDLDPPPEAPASQSVGSQWEDGWEGYDDVQDYYASLQWGHSTGRKGRKKYKARTHQPYHYTPYVDPMVAAKLAHPNLDDEPDEVIPLKPKL